MNQEIIGELEGGTCSNGAKIKIMGSEIKEDYDVNVMTFQVEAQAMQQTEHLFLVFSKYKSLGKYAPVFKTECKKP